MDSKSLMIGDWVCYDGDTEYTCPVKIEGMDVSCDSCITSDREDTGFDGVIPIPLTEEILEKNGFHTNYDHTLLGSCIYRRMCGKYDEYEVVVRMLNGWIKIKSHDDRVTDILVIDIQPRFVHQLQHALRLCGLNELADNFKI